MPRDLPATGPATLSRPCLSLRAFGLAGLGSRSPAAAAAAPGPARSSPTPTLALLPAPHTCSRPGKAAGPCARPPTVRCPQLPAAVEPCSAVAPQPFSTMTSPGSAPYRGQSEGEQTTKLALSGLLGTNLLFPGRKRLGGGKKPEGVVGTG